MINRGGYAIKILFLYYSALGHVEAMVRKAAAKKNSCGISLFNAGRCKRKRQKYRLGKAALIIQKKGSALLE